MEPDVEAERGCLKILRRVAGRGMMRSTAAREHFGDKQHLIYRYYTTAPVATHERF